MKKRSFEQIGESLFEERLPNGMRVCVVPKKGFRSCCAVLAVDYGGAHRRFFLEGSPCETPAGTAHYLEHKCFDLPEGDRTLEILTARGADPNASTGPDMTAYYFQCTEDFEENLRLLLHLVSTPYFTEETVEKERGIITQEILMGEDDPGLRLYYRLLGMLYDRHPARERVAGTAESIREITAETLALCHRAFYAPGRLALCVEGDVDPERILAAAREAFPPEPQPLPEPDFGPAESLLPLERFSREAAEISAPQFVIGAKFLPAAQGGEALRQRLVASLAVRTFLGHSSPFFTGLYAEGLLNLDFGGDIEYVPQAATLTLGGESRDPEAVLEALQRAVRELAAQGLDEERFRRAKRASLGARLRALEDFESVCFALAAGLFEGYCALDSLTMLERVEKAECERFLLDALQPERLALAVFEPKKEG